MDDIPPVYCFSGVEFHMMGNIYRSKLDATAKYSTLPLTATLHRDDPYRLQPSQIRSMNQPDSLTSPIETGTPAGLTQCDAPWIIISSDDELSTEDDTEDEPEDYFENEPEAPPMPDTGAGTCYPRRSVGSKRPSVQRSPLSSVRAFSEQSVCHPEVSGPSARISSNSTGSGFVLGDALTETPVRRQLEQRLKEAGDYRAAFMNYFAISAQLSKHMLKGTCDQDLKATSFAAYQGLLKKLQLLFRIRNWRPTQESDNPSLEITSSDTTQWGLLYVFTSFPLLGGDCSHRRALESRGTIERRQFDGRRKRPLWSFITEGAIAMNYYLTGNEESVGGVKDLEQAESRPAGSPEQSLTDAPAGSSLLAKEPTETETESGIQVAGEFLTSRHPMPSSTTSSIPAKRATTPQNASSRRVLTSSSKRRG